MAHYKKDAASNRNALFGGGGSSSSGGGRSARTSRTQQTQKTTNNIARNIPPTSTLPSLTSSTNNNITDPTITPGPSTIFTTHGRLASRGVMSLLSGQAKIDKMAEAEDYRLKVCFICLVCVLVIGAFQMHLQLIVVFVGFVNVI